MLRRFRTQELWFYESGRHDSCCLYVTTSDLVLLVLSAISTRAPTSSLCSVQLLGSNLAIANMVGTAGSALATMVGTAGSALAIMGCLAPST